LRCRDDILAGSWSVGWARAIWRTIISLRPPNAGPLCRLRWLGAASASACQLEAALLAAPVGLAEGRLAPSGRPARIKLAAGQQRRWQASSVQVAAGE